MCARDRLQYFRVKCHFLPAIQADNCVTVRDRDTMEQIRMPISELKEYIAKKVAF